MKPNIQDAVGVLRKELKADPDYYYTWQANIAMAFFDEWREDTEKTDIHTLANKGAKRFLDLLCRGG